MIWIVFMVICLIFAAITLQQSISEAKSSSIRSDFVGGQWVERKWIYLYLALAFFVLFLVSGIFYWRFNL